MNDFITLIENILNQLIGSLEWVMLIAVLGGGIYLCLISKFYPLTKIKSAFILLLSKNENQGISRFQALSAVLAATVGLGNISGVAIAIHMGGPGVLVWMWITAIIGMIIKFYSCSLSVQIRKINSDGTFLGGPMYYMSLGIKNWGKLLAIWFSIAGLFGVLPAFTANQLTQTYINVINPNDFIFLGDFQWKLITGILLALISSFVIFGGLKKIVKVTSSLVPLMVGLYFFMGLFILFFNYELVLPTFKLIFKEAFNLETMLAGGFCMKTIW